MISLNRINFLSKISFKLNFKIKINLREVNLISEWGGEDTARVSRVGLSYDRRCIGRVLSVISISSICAFLGVGKVYGQAVSQMTMREILNKYPNHRSGNIILNGRTFNNASYLDVYGSLVYPYFCPNVGGKTRNGEYLWDVSEVVYNYQPRNFSIVSIQGGCADNSRVINAGRIGGFVEDTGPRIEFFEANRNSIRLGETVNLMWRMENIRVVRDLTLAIIAGGELGNRRVPASGQMTVKPPRRGLVTYLLVGWGEKNGQSEKVEQTVQIFVQ